MSILSSKLLLLTESLEEIGVELRNTYKNKDKHNAHFAEPTTTVESCVRRLKHVIYLLENEIKEHA